MESTRRRHFLLQEYYQITALLRDLKYSFTERSEAQIAQLTDDELLKVVKELNSKLWISLGSGFY